MGWVICKVDEYMVVKRCFRCSRFNLIHKECKSVEICPLCTGNHKLKECTTPKTEHKSINSQIYSKHHTDDQIDTAHSSLDKECPSLKAALEKYRQNTDY
jgi:hypothetical protein